MVSDNSGRVRPAGVIEFGVAPAQRKEIYRVMRTFVTGEDRKNVYVRPLVRAKVKIRNWTKKGLLRSNVKLNDIVLRSPVFVEFLN